jgi:multisubunit Na+/H+ antiporter MnhG subunit
LPFAKLPFFPLFGQLLIAHFNRVIKTLGFDTTITLVLTCPPFIFAGAAGIAFGWSSGRYHERTWHITAGLGIAIVGFAVAAATLNTAARYVACFIFAMGAYSVNSVIIGWASSTLAQTKEKKAVVLAMTNVGGQVSIFFPWSASLHSLTVANQDWLHLRCLPLA